MKACLQVPLLQPLGELARKAAAAVLDIYHGDFAVQHKHDHSPLTAADLIAHRVIATGLAALADAIPLISEEAPHASWERRRHWQRYWLIDPLDGTREFIKRNGEFSINIALIEDHRPVLGIVLAPVSGKLYAAAHGHGAWLQPEVGAPWQQLRTRPLASPPVLVGSRSHGARDQWVIRRLLGEDYQLRLLGSSLKFCLLARGTADLYLRYGPTYEWDTAAAQCILEEAGGAVMDFQGQSLRYNGGETLINPEFIAVGDRRIAWTQRLAQDGNV